MSGNIPMYWMSGYFLYTRYYAISLVYWMSGNGSCILDVMQYLLYTGYQVIALVYWMSGYLLYTRCQVISLV